MQGHNMVILSQADMKISGVCRDYIGATLLKGKERVHSQLKNWGQNVVYRCDGQPSWAAPLTPFRGTNTLSPWVVLAT